MKTSIIPKDLVPYRSGVTILTPLDVNGRPIPRLAVATSSDFVNSTQVSMSRTTETLENGGGQDQEFVNAETYTLTVNTNVYDPVFHAMATGRKETLPDTTIVRSIFTHFLPTSVKEGDTLGITFGKGADVEKEPAADENGEYNFIVEDSYRNTLVRTDGTLENGTYKYDADTKTLQFSNDYLGASIRVLYYVTATDVLQYDSNPILSNPQFMVEVIGKIQNTKGTGTYQKYTKLLRATATGDMAGQAEQKSRSAPITYTFTSAPVPEGVSVYTEKLSIVSTTAGGTDDTLTTPNGVDDEPTTSSGGTGGNGGSGGNGGIVEGEEDM